MAGYFSDGHKLAAGITSQIMEIKSELTHLILTRKLAILFISLSASIALGQSNDIKVGVAHTHSTLVPLSHGWFQASNYLYVTNWGPSNCECQLSIGLDKDVIQADSIVNFHWWIKNASDRNVKIKMATKPIVYNKIPNLFITNNSGKSYPIRSGPPVDGVPSRGDADPGEFIVSDGPIFFTRDIEPGDYTLGPYIRDIITADGKTCTLTSNPVKVKIIAASP